MGNTPHARILGKEPTSEQLEFYAKFPTFLGFSDRSLNSERLEAVILKALLIKPLEDRVVMFAPVAHEEWVLEKYNSLANTVFNVCKGLRGSKVPLAQFYSKSFQRIAITGRLLQLPGEPKHWVSFGFSVEDPIPEWMSKRLISK